MATIQVVLDEHLLLKADAAAARHGINRSALMRRALRDFLRGNRRDELEQLDHDGYARVPEDIEALAVWEDLAEWPEG